MGASLCPKISHQQGTSIDFYIQPSWNRSSQSMNGFKSSNYSTNRSTNHSGRQNSIVYDKMLQSLIEQIFQNYDTDFSGQLEGQEFFYAYRDLCLKMGVNPPQSFQEFQLTVIDADSNGNQRINRFELFMLFRRINQMNPEINIYEGKELNTCCVSGISNMNGMGDMVIQQPLLQNNPFNRWIVPNCNYQTFKGFTTIDYTGGWNAKVHDQLLKNSIDAVFQTYDLDKSGFLEIQELFCAYRDLCLRMGLCPPQNFQEVLKAFHESDINDDDQISRWELFIYFKKVQHVNAGLLNYNANMMW